MMRRISFIVGRYRPADESSGHAQRGRSYIGRHDSPRLNWIHNMPFHIDLLILTFQELTER